MILLKRAYDRASQSDGERFLVERLWPRGIRKNALPVEGWLKDIAATCQILQELYSRTFGRSRFAHDHVLTPGWENRFAGPTCRFTGVSRNLFIGIRFSGILQC